MSATTNKLGRGIRNGFVVLVITLLIWFAADQGVMTEESFSITVAYISRDSQIYVGPDRGPIEREIDVTIRGRRSRLNELKSLVESDGPIEIALDDVRQPRSEIYQLSTRDDILRKVRAIRQAGTITRVSPTEATVRICDYVEVEEIPVSVEFGDLRATKDIAEKSISARIPSFVAEDSTFMTRKKAVIDGTVYITERTPGATFEFSGKPSLSGLSHLYLVPNSIRLNPATVNVTGKIESLQAVNSKGPITIKWSIPDQVQSNYRIVAEEPEFILYVDVVGPQDRVASLEASQIRAFVEVFARDETDPGPGNLIARDVQILLPNEFSDCKIADSTPRRQIRFKLEARDSETTDEATDSELGG